MDGEVGGDEQSSGDGGGGQYVIRYEKDGEMERVLEKQAELIGQYEEEERAQREWEKQYNENKNANKVRNWYVNFCTTFFFKKNCTTELWYLAVLGCTLCTVYLHRC
jgi:hypothetical protein